MAKTMKNKSGKNKSGKSMKKSSSSSNVENAVKYIKSLTPQEIKGFKKQAKELHKLLKNESLVNALKGKNNKKSKQQGGALPLQILATGAGLSIPVALIWGLCACCNHLEKRRKMLDEAWQPGGQLYEQDMAAFRSRIEEEYAQRPSPSSSESSYGSVTPPHLRPGRAQYYGNA